MPTGGVGKKLTELKYISFFAIFESALKAFLPAIGTILYLRGLQRHRIYRGKQFVCTSDGALKQGFSRNNSTFLTLGTFALISPWISLRGEAGFSGTGLRCNRIAEQAV
ncbi:MAG: hypothetical protein HGB01_02340 [Chlorobiaceae bacterium]|nr:hypothetical protein [Chlorobiales bacterium]NTU91228.1 hypothetical protein [Chlorobiaceae bacterium]NTV25032.1 hypothetical protein [Chlorobiaceae bacterium]